MNQKKMPSKHLNTDTVYTMLLKLIVQGDIDNFKSLINSKLIKDDIMVKYCIESVCSVGDEEMLDVLLPLSNKNHSYEDAFLKASNHGFFSLIEKVVSHHDIKSIDNSIYLDAIDNKDIEFLKFFKDKNLKMENTPIIIPSGENNEEELNSLDPLAYAIDGLSQNSNSKSFKEAKKVVLFLNEFASDDEKVNAIKCCLVHANTQKYIIDILFDYKLHKKIAPYIKKHKINNPFVDYYNYLVTSNEVKNKLKNQVKKQNIKKIAKRVI